VVEIDKTAFAVKVAVATTTCTEERVLGVFVGACFQILIAPIITSSSNGHCMVAATLLVPSFFLVTCLQLDGESAGTDA